MAEGNEVAVPEKGQPVAGISSYKIPVEEIVDNFKAYRELVANLITDDDHVFFVTYMVNKGGKLRQKMEPYRNKKAAEERMRVLKEKKFKPNIVPRMLKSGVEKLFKAMNMIQRNKFFPRWIKEECKDNTEEFLQGKASGKNPILWVKRVLGIFEAVTDENGQFIRHPQTGNLLMVERERSEAWASMLEKRSFAHLPHDVIALAETRCFNRTVMRMLGMGQVTAEEIGSMGGGDAVIEAEAFIVDSDEEAATEEESEEMPEVSQANPEKEGRKPSEKPQKSKEAEKQADTPKEEEAAAEAPKAEETTPKEEDDPKARVGIFSDACKGKNFGSDRKVMGKVKEAIFHELKLDAEKLITQVTKEEFDKVIATLHKYSREEFLYKFLVSRGVKLNKEEFEVWKSEALKIIEAESFDAMSLPQFKKAIEIAEDTEAS